MTESVTIPKVELDALKERVRVLEAMTGTESQSFLATESFLVTGVARDGGGGESRDRESRERESRERRDAFPVSSKRRNDSQASRLASSGEGGGNGVVTSCMVTSASAGDEGEQIGVNASV